ncbi:MAG: AbrB/MazE/SpoVT family DNA-binding domain-containing protein [Turicibacter sp.]|nr:AbrB/MazE/SpoVT family DNA-binding domain-containing protein [Turicibacter sp.]
MGLVTVQKDGQITIPLEIQQKLNLKEGGKVGFVEENGEYKIVSPTKLAILEGRKALSGLAEAYGWETVEDVVKTCRQFRKERSKNANNA